MNPVARICFSLLLSLPVLINTGNSHPAFVKNNTQTHFVLQEKKPVNSTTVKSPATKKKTAVKLPKAVKLPSLKSVPDTLPPIVFALAPDLTVQTKVMGQNRNIAQVSFYYGGLLVYIGTVMQTSPLIVTTDDVIVGFLQINKGMSITLAIPSVTQPGQILLKAQYTTKDHPSTTYSGLVATWSL